MTEVHICPLLMRTVIWEDGKCTDDCSEDCLMVPWQQSEICLNNTFWQI